MLCQDTKYLMENGSTCTKQNRIMLRAHHSDEENLYCGWTITVLIIFLVKEDFKLIQILLGTKLVFQLRAPLEFEIHLPVFAETLYHDYFLFYFMTIVCYCRFIMRLCLICFSYSLSFYYFII